MLDNNYNKTLTNSIKKKIQSIFKNIGYSLSKAFYGHIKGVIESKNNPSIEIIEKIDSSLMVIEFSEKDRYMFIKVRMNLARIQILNTEIQAEITKMPRS